jgi:nitrite reductase (NADH) small subunit
MNDRQWLRITASENIPPREGRAAMAGGREIALFNLGDRFLAVDNRCPHKGGPLSDGIVAGESVVCPLHAWKVSLETGCVERPAGSGVCVRTYATRLEAGVVLVELPGDLEPETWQAAATSDGGITTADHGVSQVRFDANS